MIVPHHYYGYGNNDPDWIGIGCGFLAIGLVWGIVWLMARNLK